MRSKRPRRRDSLAGENRLAHRAACAAALSRAKASCEGDSVIAVTPAPRFHRQRRGQAAPAAADLEHALAALKVAATRRYARSSLPAPPQGRASSRPKAPRNIACSASSHGGRRRCRDRSGLRYCAWLPRRELLCSRWRSRFAHLTRRPPAQVRFHASAVARGETKHRDEIGAGPIGIDIGFGEADVAAGDQSAKRPPAIEDQSSPRAPASRRS